MEKESPQILERYKELSDKWQRGSISTDELNELEQWYYSEMRETSSILENLSASEGSLRQSIFAEIRRKTGLELKVFHLPKTKNIAQWAAVFIIMIMLPLLMHNRKKDPAGKFATTVDVVKDVNVGHSGAVLKLSNGATIILDSAKDGAIANQESAKIIKEGSFLKYVGKPSEMVYNTVTTQRGKQWAIVLSNGTRVWLNAASSIKYPLSFLGNERMVELSGEAYFEVVHDPKKPFKVKIGNETIEDIGTSFNVNAYSDEPEMRMTLVTGSIKIKDEVLVPGQRASITNGKIEIAKGDTTKALAWKNGFFSFEHADIYQVMRQVSRWYNVDVSFVGKPKRVFFEGEIGRTLTLSQILTGLEKVHAHFKIKEDGNIVVLCDQCAKAD